MDIIHAREYLAPNQFVRVECDTQCNVMLTDDLNFGRYQRGDSFQHCGGFYKAFPIIIKPPHAGHWNITIDFGGGEAVIRYNIRVMTE